MKKITALVRVKKNRGNSVFGGCIFTGVPLNEDGSESDSVKWYAVELPPKLVGNLEVQKGQWWRVTGYVLSKKVVTKSGYLYEELHLKASKCTAVQPSGDILIEYLKGITTERKAKLLWNKFGTNLISALDLGNIEDLSEVILVDAATEIVSAWEISGASDTLNWLMAHGFPMPMGLGLWRRFGRETKSKIEEDPYRLLSWEASWKKVDALARKEFGVAEDDMRRLQGAVEESLYRIFRDGHTMAKIELLQKHLVGLIGNETPEFKWKQLVSDSLDAGLDNGTYIVGTLNHIHPIGPWSMEMRVARFVASRLKSMNRSALLDEYNLAEVIQSFENDAKLQLTDEQKNAIRVANNNSFCIITGGAGTGKTTVLEALYRVYEASGTQVMQMALAGRAAQRMKEATKLGASTIASFMVNVSEAELKNQKKVVVVIDETSMVDIITMSKLCRMLPSNVRIVLLGDPNQLMPVGPGLVLHALVQIEEVPNAKLSIVKRYQGELLSAAQSILRGEWPELTNDPSAEICFIEASGNDIADIVVDLYFKHKDDSQILSPRKVGFDGTNKLNELCQARYTNGRKRLTTFNEEDGVDKYTGFNIGDALMCTRNHWRLGLQNGSVGRLMQVEDHPVPVFDDKEEDKIAGYSLGVIEWDDGSVRPLERALLNDLELAYAITVHKSQGSQWPRVIIPLTKNENLDRTFIYTAVTRARAQVIIVGDSRAAREAVERPTKAESRMTGLATFIQEMVDEQIVV
jgi:exodeoxyribonuclease V alpha subunit